MKDNAGCLPTIPKLVPTGCFPRSAYHECSHDGPELLRPPDVKVNMDVIKTMANSLREALCKACDGKNSIVIKITLDNKAVRTIPLELNCRQECSKRISDIVNNNEPATKGE